MTARLCWLVLACAVAVLRPEGQAPLAQTQERYEIVATRNVMVAARDGVRLATDVYVPGRGGTTTGRFPAVVERTPYNKDSAANQLPAYFVPRGYAVVLQDIRGRYRSEGKWRPIQDDGPDGADLLKWIAEQPWSNGKVGTAGTSYGGATQHAIGITNAPALAAMVPVDAMSNYGQYGIRHNGAFELRWLNWIFTLGNATGIRASATGLDSSPNGALAAARAAVSPDAVTALQEMGEHVREYARALPLRPGTTPLKFAPDYEAWFIEAMRHGDNDAYWANMGSSVVDHIAEYQDVPSYHVTGWYDSWGSQVANLNYVQLSKAKKSLQRLIVGPWTHGGQGQTFAGIGDFGPEAAVDMNALRHRWYDRWLLGLQNGVDKEPPVRIFVMGGGDAHKTPEGRLFVGGSWRDEREWPLARTANTPYYLHENGTLSPDAPKPSSTPTRYSFDPRNPVPTIGGNVSSEGALMPRGAQDQRCYADHWLCKDTLPLSARQDVVVFQTPPLVSDVEVTGRLVVKLWASSNAPDTDFTAKLIDVYPPSKDFPSGVDLNIGDSIVRARYRESLKTAKMLEPGRPVEFTIEMYPTSLVFKRGHRIRLDISSSNFPRFDVNPNTGEPLNQNRRSRIADNAVYHDAQHPSRIILPIIPRQSSATLIRHALIIDGSGGPAARGDVRVAGDRIVAMGQLTPVETERVVDGEGLALAPGFIDTHSHHDRGLDGARDALAMVSQGVTTIVAGQDGGGSNLAALFARLESQPVSVNVASYAGHGAIRSRVMGQDFKRHARPDEVDRMKLLVKAEMDAGALGLSTGLEYDPGINSAPEEVIALAKVSGDAGGRYISHIRSEDRWFWDALDEVIAIGRANRMPVQVSHLKLGMHDLWGQAEKLIGVLDRARAAGVQLTADIYPYTYWQSNLGVLYPKRNYSDAAETDFVLAHVSLAGDIIFNSFRGHPDYVGRTLAQVADVRQAGAAKTLMELLAEPGGASAGIVAKGMADADVERLLQWPFANVCSDGQSTGLHPRGFGSFSKVLGPYVRDRKLFTVEEAVRKMSTLAAANVGLVSRGRIAPGYFADLVLFDPRTVADRADFGKAQAQAVGIHTVWVNGQVVFQDGKTTGVFSGRPLRREKAISAPH